MRTATIIRDFVVTRFMIGIILPGVLTLPALAVAKDCGDADSSGNISVTDGVAMLRVAAGLPDRCPRRRCDMNADGVVTVTDAVGALRVAAGLDAVVQCSEAQVDSIFGHVTKTPGATSAAAHASVRAAQTTPCSDGGFTEDDGTTTRFVNCREQDVVTNGTITKTDTGPDRFSLTYALTDVYVSPAEAIQTTGTLDLAVFGTAIAVNGVLEQSSSLVGSYASSYREVTLDTNGNIDGGEILVAVTDGRNALIDVREIDFNIYSTTLFQAVIAYADDDFEIYIFGDAICTSCSSRVPCEDATTVCAPCTADCTGDESRCSIDFGSVDCADGAFGPSDLCAPCTRDTDCSLNLVCEICQSDCSGTAHRCASPTAYVDCEDGTF